MVDTTLNRRLLVGSLERAVFPSVDGADAVQLRSSAQTARMFEAAYAEYSPQIWRLLRRLGVPVGELEDLVQDVFTVVLRKLPEFEGRSSLRTWIYAIAIRKANKHRSPPAATMEADELSARAGDPHRELESLEGMRLFEVIVDEMDDDKRDVFVLAEVEQLCVREIAEVLGLKLFTVYSRLRAARKAFDKSLARRRFLQAQGAR